MNMPSESFFVRQAALNVWPVEYWKAFAGERGWFLDSMEREPKIFQDVRREYRKLVEGWKS